MRPAGSCPGAAVANRVARRASGGRAGPARLRSPRPRRPARPRLHPRRGRGARAPLPRAGARGPRGCRAEPRGAAGRRRRPPKRRAGRGVADIDRAGPAQIEGDLEAVAPVALAGGAQIRPVAVGDRAGAPLPAGNLEHDAPLGHGGIACPTGDPLVVEKADATLDPGNVNGDPRAQPIAYLEQRHLAFPGHPRRPCRVRGRRSQMQAR